MNLDSGAYGSPGTVDGTHGPDVQAAQREHGCLLPRCRIALLLLMTVGGAAGSGEGGCDGVLANSSRGALPARFHVTTAILYCAGMLA